MQIHSPHRKKVPTQDYGGIFRSRVASASQGLYLCREVGCFLESCPGVQLPPLFQKYPLSFFIGSTHKSWIALLVVTTVWDVRSPNPVL